MSIFRNNIFYSFSLRKAVALEVPARNNKNITFFIFISILRIYKIYNFVPFTTINDSFEPHGNGRWLSVDQTTVSQWKIQKRVHKSGSDLTGEENHENGGLNMLSMEWLYGPSGDLVKHPPSHNNFSRCYINHSWSAIFYVHDILCSSAIRW